MNRRIRGFTLIELMIVLAVIAILTAIAIPAYSQWVEKSRRQDAEAALVELANYMERFYSNNGGYVDAAGNAPTLPYTTTPKGGSNVYYTLALTNVTETTYKLTATPKNSQADDPCGTLSITQSGVQGASGAMSADECW